MNISVISGSRADSGLLYWPTKLLKDDPYFAVAEVSIWGQAADQALNTVGNYLADARPDMVLLLGDRFEIMAAAMAAHLQRIPIAHIGGGDVTLGSYDDAMRDCISRLATLHFATSDAAWDRLTHMVAGPVHLVGNPAVDYIRHVEWKGMCPYPKPYVVVAYYPETIDRTVDLEAVREAIGGRRAIWISPNPDLDADKIPPGETLEHNLFLNLLHHCDEFIGNSSAILYEAPELGVKTRMIGKRQAGRVAPWGDGRAGERIVKVLREWRPL